MNQNPDQAQMNLIQNGAAFGDVASLLLNEGFSPQALRPWVGDDGRSYVTRNVNGKPASCLLTNANATLRKDEWKLLDEAIVSAAKERLRLVADIRSAGLTFTIPDGMGTTVLQTETVSDITGASIAMDPNTQGENDRPQFALGNLPLPVIFKDFFFSVRQIATSRKIGAPIDVTTGQLAARRVSESIEDMFINGASLAFGGGNIYGLTNFPSRITQVLTNPGTSPWTPADLVSEVLAMKQKSQVKFHYGPWMLYTAPNWDQYLDADYSAAKGDNTLRERLGRIEGIRGIRTLDRLTGFQMLLTQFTADVTRAVIGMDISTLQWPSNGGLTQNFKVMAIIVPQLRADYNGNTGIVHGNTA